MEGSGGESRWRVQGVRVEGSWGEGGGSTYTAYIPSILYV